MTAPVLAAITADEARDLTARINTAAGELWRLLLESYEREAWKALEYRSWREYAAAEFRMSERRAYQLLSQGQVTEALETSVCTSVQISEAAARDIKPKLPEVVAEVRERVERGEEPKQAVREAVAAHRPPKAPDPTDRLAAMRAAREQQARNAPDPLPPVVHTATAPDTAETMRHARRPVDARIRALLDAAHNMAGVTDDELSALQTNDLMVEGLRKAVAQINRIIESHSN